MLISGFSLFVSLSLISLLSDAAAQAQLHGVSDVLIKPLDRNRIETCLQNYKGALGSVPETQMNSTPSAFCRNAYCCSRIYIYIYLCWRDPKLSHRPKSLPLLM